MKIIDVTETREITYTIVLSEKEVSDIKAIAMCEVTVPEAMRKAGLISQETAERLEFHTLPDLVEMFETKGVVASA